MTESWWRGLLKHRSGNQYLKITRFLLLGLSLVLCSSNVQCRSVQKTSVSNVRQEMFGIRLRPKAIKLLREIEQHFGKKVGERSLEDPNIIAHAGIDTDGTPYIATNKSKNYGEGIIVHELFHLKLWAEGYPLITFEYPTVFNVNEAPAKWLMSHLYDPLEHSIFYPRMREMGLDPAAEHRAAFEKILEERDYADMPATFENEGRALHYVEAALHLNDQKFLERVRQYYKAKQWDLSLKKGEKIVDIIVERKLIDSEAIISLFVDCLNVLNQGSEKFELHRWERRAMGNHTALVAIIRILPNTRK